MAGAVAAGPERLDDRRAGRCARAVADGVRVAAGGAAVRADVAVEDGASDAAELVFEPVRLVDAATLAVRPAQRARLRHAATSSTTAA